jgi:hypothetical protein
MTLGLEASSLKLEMVCWCPVVGVLVLAGAAYGKKYEVEMWCSRYVGECEGELGITRTRSTAK